MKKILLAALFFLIGAGALIVFTSSQNRVCAGSKCRYDMVCGGNANIKATICTTDCNDSSTKAKAKEWFKSKCSSASTPSSYKSGWDNCDVKL
jgi:hypothetical protein